MSEKREKQLQKLREQCSAAVESGETVRHAITAMKGPLVAAVAGPVGIAAFWRPRSVALTEKALYVMVQKRSGAEAEQRLPLGSVAVRAEKSRFPFWSTLTIGDQRLNVPNQLKNEADRLAAAASAGSAPTRAV